MTINFLDRLRCTLNPLVINGTSVYTRNLLSVTAFGLLNYFKVQLCIFVCVCVCVRVRARV